MGRVRNIRRSEACPKFDPLFVSGTLYSRLLCDSTFFRRDDALSVCVYRLGNHAGRITSSCLDAAMEVELAYAATIPTQNFNLLRRQPKQASTGVLNAHQPARECRGWGRCP